MAPPLSGPQKHIRWLLGLVIVLLGLILAVGFIRMSDERIGESQQLLNPLNASRIDIQLHKPGNSKSTILQKTNDQWWISGNPEKLANSQRVGPILSLLNLPNRTSYRVDEIDLQELGLDPPRATVKINQITFSFGSMATSQTERYVMVNQRIHLYNEMIFPLINSGPAALIDVQQ